MKLKNILLTNKFLLFFIIINTLIESSSAVLSPVFMFFLTSALVNHNYNYVSLFGALWLLNWIFISWYGIWFNFFKTKLVYKTIFFESNAFVSRLMKISYTKFNSLDSGTYYSWLENDISIWVSQLIENTISLLNTIFSLLFLLVATFIINWILGLIALGFGILLLVIPNLWANHAKKQTNIILKKISNFNQKVNHLIEGFSVMFFSFKLHLLPKKISEYNQKIIKAEIKRNLINSNANLSKDFLLRFGILTLQIISAILVLYKLNYLYINSVGISIIVYTVVSSNSLLEKFNSFGKILFNLKMYKTANFNIENFFLKNNNVENLGQKKISLPFKSLQFKNVLIHYGQKVILKNFNLNIESNKKYLIIGKNGSGKSSLVQTLFGLKRDYEGSLQINGIEVKDILQENLNELISWNDNKQLLLDGSVRDNLTMFDNQSKDVVLEETLKKLNLNQTFKLDDQLSLTKTKTSTGELQRLQLGRSLLQKKPILILDEALSNLDLKNHSLILNTLLANKNLTLIYINHHYKKESFEKFDQVIQLNSC